LKTKGNSGTDGNSQTRPKQKHTAQGNGAGPHAEGRPACEKRTRPGKSQ
jgi:hypothetical protein